MKIGAEGAGVGRGGMWPRRRTGRSNKLQEANRLMNRSNKSGVTMHSRWDDRICSLLFRYMHLCALFVHSYRSAVPCAVCYVLAY